MFSLISVTDIVIHRCVLCGIRYDGRRSKAHCFLTNISHFLTLFFLLFSTYSDRADNNSKPYAFVWRFTIKYVAVFRQLDDLLWIGRRANPQGQQITGHCLVALLLDTLICSKTSVELLWTFVLGRQKRAVYFGCT